MQTFDYLVVGAGFAGSVIAERLASQAGQRVLIVDRRPHVAGNAYDHVDSQGLLVHKYGPHIFHTNSARVFDYLSQFTEWRPYEHRVLASVDGKLVPIPINRTTINVLYGLDLVTEEECAAFFDRVAEPRERCRTSEDTVVSKVGRELYEKFFRNYTRKQWDLDPSQLDASVTARIPVRTNTDDRYFTDTYQAMPLHGYTRMFKRMLSHPNIAVELNTDYRELNGVRYREMVYTGPVDEYFGYCFSKLPYRSLHFKHEVHPIPVFQTAPVVNYPNEHRYTRITEFKYLTGQQHPKTAIVYEFPRAEGDPYYPVPRPENAELYKKYKAMADTVPNVHFVGRLATYKYYNMDQVTAQALTTFEELMRGRTQPARQPAVVVPDVPATTVVPDRVPEIARVSPVSRTIAAAMSAPPSNRGVRPSTAAAASAGTEAAAS
jgi:UDP-galactopyranose mutase